MDERRSRKSDLKHKKLIGTILLILSFGIIILLAFFIYLLGINQLADTDQTLRKTITNLEELDKQYNKIINLTNLNESLENTDNQIKDIDNLLTYYNNNLNVLEELKKDPTISKSNKDQLDKLIAAVNDKIVSLNQFKDLLELHALKIKLNNILVSFDQCIKKINFAQKDNLKISNNITNCINTSQNDINNLKNTEQDLINFFTDCSKDDLPVERVETFVNIYTNMATYYRYIAQKRYDKAKIYDSKYQESIKMYNNKPAWDDCIKKVFNNK